MKERIHHVGLEPGSMLFSFAHIRAVRWNSYPRREKKGHFANNHSFFAVSVIMGALKEGSLI